ncbi:MAG: kinesin family protein [archaeon]|nr:kinesin family protein [archaeon]
MKPQRSSVRKSSQSNRMVPIDKTKSNEDNSSKENNMKAYKYEGEPKKENSTLKRKQSMIQNVPIITNNLAQKFSKNNMIVAIRVRPLSSSELSFSNINTVEIQNKENVTLTTPLEFKNDVNGKYYLNEEKNMSITKKKENRFAFDFAFDEKTTQEDVYTTTTQSLLQSVIDGYNATVLAYGQTGSGKTYTMVGNNNEPGLMIRALNDLFSLVEKQKQNLKKSEIKISYIEVYNEKLRDLLKTDTYDNILDLRDDPQKGTVIVGAENKIVTNVNDAFKLIM